MKSKKITSASSESSETAAELYEFNPHIYPSIIADEIPSEYWDSLYNMIDALRAGAGSFDCASQEAYDWCMDVTTLANLVPAACLAITIKCRKKLSQRV